MLIIQIGKACGVYCFVFVLFCSLQNTVCETSQEWKLVTTALNLTFVLFLTLWHVEAYLWPAAERGMRIKTDCVVWPTFQLVCFEEFLRWRNGCFRLWFQPLLCYANVLYMPGWPFEKEPLWSFVARPVLGRVCQIPLKVGKVNLFRDHRKRPLLFRWARASYCLLSELLKLLWWLIGEWCVWEGTDWSSLEAGKLFA